MHHHRALQAVCLAVLVETRRLFCLSLFIDTIVPLVGFILSLLQFRSQLLAPRPPPRDFLLQLAGNKPLILFVGILQPYVLL